VTGFSKGCLVTLHELVQFNVTQDVRGITYGA